MNNIFAIEKWKQRARGPKTETYVLYLAYRHPSKPWCAKRLRE